MGRGLGERQRRMLDQLRGTPDEWVPLHRLADDPDDPNEMAKARSAARGLQRRGLVFTDRMADEDRRVDTTIVHGDVGAGWDVVYAAEPGTRAWSGMHVQLADPEHRAPWAEAGEGFAELLDKLLS